MLRLVAMDRLDERETSDLHEVVELHPTTAVAARHGGAETEIQAGDLFDEALTLLTGASRGQFGEQPGRVGVALGERHAGKG